MNNLASVLQAGIASLLPMHIADINTIANAQVMHTIANPSDVVYMTIEQVQRVEENPLRLTPEGQPHGVTYEVLYRLSMRHENALSTNLMTDILDLELSGMESRITRDALYLGRNVYYLMSVQAIALIAYPLADKHQQPIQRVYLSLNGRDALQIEISEDNNIKEENF